jgi:hypothetical protein
MGMPTVPFAFSRQNPTAAADRGGLGVAILAGTMRQLRASTVCDQSIRGPRSDAEYLARRQASEDQIPHSGNDVLGTYPALHVAI